MPYPSYASGLATKAYIKLYFNAMATYKAKRIRITIKSQKPLCGDNYKPGYQLVNIQEI